MEVSFNLEAAAEVEDAARWYREEGGSLTATAFVQELERVVRLAATSPSLGSPGPTGTRRLYLRRFPFTLVYQVQCEAVRIIAVAHQRRRPRYWTGRR